MVVLGRDSFIWLEGSKQSAGLKSVSKKVISLISSFSNFLTSSPLVRFFRLTAPATVQGGLPLCYQPEKPNYGPDHVQLSKVNWRLKVNWKIF